MPFKFRIPSFGGTVGAIAGVDFVLVCTDTRITRGSRIVSRECDKLTVLPNNIIMGVAGDLADAEFLGRIVKVQSSAYFIENNRQMSLEATAQFLSVYMYSKRFSPLYVMTVLAGLDSNGKGLIYSYDPIGHCSTCSYCASGTAGTVIETIWDQRLKKGPLDNTPYSYTDFGIAALKDMIYDSYQKMGNIDEKTGDDLIIKIITKNGIEIEKYPLSKKVHLTKTVCPSEGSSSSSDSTGNEDGKHGSTNLPSDSSSS